MRDAERNLFAAEQALLQLRRAEVDNPVALYIALGGGMIGTVSVSTWLEVERA